jgi:hypothetical protein
MKKHLVPILVTILFIVSTVSPIVIGFEADAVSEMAVEVEPKLTKSGMTHHIWPMFGHDIRHTGRSPYGMKGTGLQEKWRVKLAGYVTFSTPVIDSNGITYIGSKGPGSNGTLHAVYPNGTKKWEFRTNSAIGASPAIKEDGTIYVASDSKLYSIKTNGTKNWDIKLGSTIITSPAISDYGTIYIGANKKLYAINTNGTIKWSYKTGEVICASPAIGNSDTIYVSSHDGNFYAINSNGTLKWSKRIGGYIECYSSPAIDNTGIIYIGGGDTFYAFYPDGEIKWKYTAVYPLFSGSPTIDYDRTIYTGSHDSLWAFDQMGNLKWRRSLGDLGYSSAITNNNLIYIGANNKLYFISQEGKIFSHLILEGDKEYDGSSIFSPPSIGSDGTVYIGSWFYSAESFDGYLHAIETIENEPPDKPIINVTKKVRILRIYNFSAVSIDPDGDNISYYFDWDDVSLKDWTNYKSSGVPVYRTHGFFGLDTYTVKVIAMDEHGSLSEWATVEIRVPKSQNVYLGWLERFPRLQRILDALGRI